ncbi:OmpH family outer membrane protein [Aliiroseovarius crassostreae]|uniref:OmpH family outer membrane protein n=1 Tax=Aliiroseovarius crassostreae TaxID=154981 RepID=UPI00220431E8|nr:OmpH family outer membrane protein [Aliiroseovarius crassostreae]UWP99821.1 OmpH family outer membrane protein [Aliiroseovarius crassostreae]
MGRTQPSETRRARQGPAVGIPARTLGTALGVMLGVGAATGLAVAQDSGAPASQPATAAAPASSVSAQASHILTVDRDRLFTQSEYGRRILQELEAERARLASEARRVDDSLAAEEKRLTEERARLSPEAFRALADAFDEKVQALRAQRPEQERSFTERFEREQQAYFDRIGPILGAVVRERGGVVIVDRRAILLTTQNIDITDQAIALIDRLLGDGTGSKGPTVPSPPATSESENGADTSSPPESPPEADPDAGDGN